MLQNIRKLIQDTRYIEALELCAKYQYFFTRNMLFYVCYAKCISMVRKDPRAVIHLLLQAIQCNGPPSLVAKCYENLTYLNQHLIPAHLRIIDGRNKPILLTVTSCKRIPLLVRMLHSLHYIDMSSVASILIVDDNSDPQELKEGLENICAPIDVIAKPPTARGHAQSMNIIRDYLISKKFEYVVHIEDDFEFKLQLPLIQWCVDVLENYPEYGQCLFNNGYREDITDQPHKPYGIPRISSTGTRFYEHQYGDSRMSPCSYWPHFSLRPGLYRVSALEIVGKFVHSGAFEKEYALRYIEAGFKTAYLEGLYCNHIGRKTSERFSAVDNAYTLNSTPQFGPQDLCAFLVNLDRRADRRNNIKLPSLPPITIFSAIDGQTLTPSSALNGLFQENTVDMTAGIVGCALSHLVLWRRLLQHYEQTPQYLVIEDDARFATNFELEIARLQSYLGQGFVSWDIIFIGYHTNLPSPLATEYLYQPRSFNEAFHVSFGGTFGYLINHTGARKLLAFIAKYGMVNAIDTVMQRCIDVGLKIFYLSTPIVWSDARSLDSDIQKTDFSLYTKELPRAPWSEIESFIDSLS